jgi:hypothetical protein
MQFGAGYPMTSQGKADFKRKFLAALNEVKKVFALGVGKTTSETGCLIYVPGRPDVPKQTKKIILPG